MAAFIVITIIVAFLSGYVAGIFTASDEDSVYYADDASVVYDRKTPYGTEYAVEECGYVTIRREALEDLENTLVMFREAYVDIKAKTQAMSYEYPPTVVSGNGDTITDNHGNVVPLNPPTDNGGGGQDFSA